MLEMKNGFRTYKELSLEEALAMEPKLYAAIRNHHEYTMKALETRPYGKSSELFLNHNKIWELHANLINHTYNLTH